MNLSEIKSQSVPLMIINNLLSRNRLPAAVVMHGQNGVGKFNTALGIAKYLNCSGENRGEDNCNDCSRIESLTYPDLHVFDPEGKQIKIEQVREIIRNLSLKSFENKHKVFIIKEAESLTVEAANCLLKSLEEPPPGNFIILISSNIEKILPTILSRCLIIKFGILKSGDVNAILRDKYNLSETDADYFSSICGGSVSNAVCYYENREQIVENFEFLKQGVCGVGQNEMPDFMKLLEEISSDKWSALIVLNLLLEDYMKLFLSGGCPVELKRIAELRELIDRFKVSSANFNLRLSLENFFLK